MDLNSYLTDFFRLLQNNNNNIYGGNMYGGALPPGHWCLTAKPGGSLPTNAEIIARYFTVPASVTTITVDSGIILTADSALRADFIQYQPDIVQHMLTANASNNGSFISTVFKGGYSRGMYGGGPFTAEPPTAAGPAAAAAAALASGAPPGGTPPGGTGGPGGTSGSPSGPGVEDPLLTCISVYLHHMFVYPDVNPNPLPTEEMVIESFRRGFDFTLIRQKMADITTLSGSLDSNIVDVKEAIYKASADDPTPGYELDLKDFIVSIKEVIYEKYSQ